MLFTVGWYASESDEGVNDDSSRALFVFLFCPLFEICTGVGGAIFIREMMFRVRSAKTKQQASSRCGRGRRIVIVCLRSVQWPDQASK